MTAARQKAAMANAMNPFRRPHETSAINPPIASAKASNGSNCTLASVSIIVNRGEAIDAPDTRQRLSLKNVAALEQFSYTKLRTQQIII